MYCLWLLSCDNAELSSCKSDQWPTKPKIFTIWPITAKAYVVTAIRKVTDLYGLWDQIPHLSPFYPEHLSQGLSQSMVGRNTSSHGFILLPQIKVKSSRLPARYNQHAWWRGVTQGYFLLSTPYKTTVSKVNTSTGHNCADGSVSKRAPWYLTASCISVGHSKV